MQSGSQKTNKKKSGLNGVLSLVISTFETLLYTFHFCVDNVFAYLRQVEIYLPCVDDS